MIGKKVVIVVFKDEAFKGYIKSINYFKGTFNITEDVLLAKNYKSMSSVMKGLNFCSKVDDTNSYLVNVLKRRRFQI